MGNQETFSLSSFKQDGAALINSAAELHKGSLSDPAFVQFKYLLRQAFLSCSGLALERKDIILAIKEIVTGEEKAE